MRVPITEMVWMGVGDYIRWFGYVPSWRCGNTYAIGTETGGDWPCFKTFNPIFIPSRYHDLIAKISFICGAHACADMMDVVEENDLDLNP